MYQIGRQNLDGTPVAREVQALDDIEGATGASGPIFFRTILESRILVCLLALRTSRRVSRQEKVKSRSNQKLFQSR